MLKYVNDFNCTCPIDQSSIMVMLSQIHPDFLSRESEPPGSVREEIESIIMDSNTAIALATAILQLLEENNETEKQ